MLLTIDRFLLINIKDKSAIIEKIKVPIHISPIYGTLLIKVHILLKMGTIYMMMTNACNSIYQHL